MPIFSPEKRKEQEDNVSKYRFIDKLTLVETGKKMGLSRERIRQIELRVWRQLMKGGMYHGKLVASDR